MPSSSSALLASTWAPHYPSAQTRRGVAILAVLGILATVIFGAISSAVAQGATTLRWDLPVTHWMVAQRSTWLTPPAWWATHVGGTIGLTVATVAICAAFAAKHWYRHAVILGLTMASSAAATVVLKLAWARQRPDVSFLLGAPSSSFSFPSGHSFNTAVFSFTLAGFVLASAASRRWKTAALTAATALTVAVGLSRLYLAYHWLTDVLAGWSLGIAWVCLSTLIVTRLASRRSSTASYSPASATDTPPQATIGRRAPEEGAAHRSQ